MNEKRELPTLAGVEPIAICGICNGKMYPNGNCSAAGTRPENCPLNGEEWSQMMRLRGMRNTYVARSDQ